jgi:CBS domain-containing protein
MVPPSPPQILRAIVWRSPRLRTWRQSELAEHGTRRAPTSRQEASMHTSAIMTRNVVVVSPTLPVGVAARLMQQVHVRHLPVVEERKLVGILSDRDLVKHAAHATCGEAMTPAPITCSPDASVGRVASLMLEHKIDSIPIVGISGTLIGLVTSTDLLGLLVDRAQAQVLPFQFEVRVADSDSAAAPAV